ncbi:hypothetical protein PFISCL1PPCAC_27657, partial [Pristionchus fissidentatus]
RMRLLYLLLLLSALLICRTDAAPRVMIRSGGRLDRIQEQTMENWSESLNKHKHHHHHKSKRHRHKRRHHHKRKREEKDVDSILLDLDKIMRPRFG